MAAREPSGSGDGDGVDVHASRLDDGDTTTILSGECASSGELALIDVSDGSNVSGARVRLLAPQSTDAAGDAARDAARDGAGVACGATEIEIEIEIENEIDAPLREHTGAHDGAAEEQGFEDEVPEGELGELWVGGTGKLDRIRMARAAPWLQLMLNEALAAPSDASALGAPSPASAQDGAPSHAESPTGEVHAEGNAAEVNAPEGIAAGGMTPEGIAQEGMATLRLAWKHELGRYAITDDH
ncbi:hypothetical protein Ctob_006722 [Chrysochromulina tobinii]|uniref:Uncharacterized protein n=1 Tax=Chrysochromulina tobinii TaxID=1460289 RepID=A0A0M0JAB8_9EUKA|nr:hypothetical protein Ctob_006722 [Chrysochromulina tobinii]|eukprot:KOO23307.1 hypothetical protein Ctob_006722 [Chrysochromulina sp. CCMP291]